MTTLKNPYSGAIRITWIVIGIAAAAVVVGIPLRSTGRVAPVILLTSGVAIGGFGLIMLPILYLYGKLLRLQGQQLIDGHHLAHWVYGQSEWDTFTEAEWAAAGGRAARRGLQAAGMMVLVGVAVSFLADDVSLVGGVALGAGLGVVMGAIVGGLLYAFAAAEHRTRRSAPGEVYIGTGGVIQNGSFTSWSVAGMTLNDVRLDAGAPAVMQFEITSSRGASSSLRIPVPSGQEHSAATVVQALGGHAEPRKKRKAKTATTTAT